MRKIIMICCVLLLSGCVNTRVAVRTVEEELPPEFMSADIVHPKLSVAYEDMVIDGMMGTASLGYMETDSEVPSVLIPNYQPVDMVVMAGSQVDLNFNKSPNSYIVYKIDGQNMSLVVNDSYTIEVGTTLGEESFLVVANFQEGTAPFAFRLYVTDKESQVGMYTRIEPMKKYVQQHVTYYETLMHSCEWTAYGLEGELAFSRKEEYDQDLMSTLVAIEAKVGEELSFTIFDETFESLKVYQMVDDQLVFVSEGQGWVRVPDSDLEEITYYVEEVYEHGLVNYVFKVKIVE